MTLNFDHIRLRDGNSYSFAGVVENVSASNGESVLVDNEGALRESDNRTNTTIQRTAIGTAIVRSSELLPVAGRERLSARLSARARALVVFTCRVVMI